MKIDMADFIPGYRGSWAIGSRDGAHRIRAKRAPGCAQVQCPLCSSGHAGVPPIASTAYSTSTLPAFSNCSVPLTRLPCSNGCLQPDEHQVIGAGLEFDGLAGLDLDAVGQLPHLHHAAVHRHLVDLEFAGGRIGAADQPVGLGPGVDELHVAAGDLRALGRGAGPGMFDLDRTGLVLVGGRRTRRPMQKQQQAEWISL